MKLGKRRAVPEAVAVLVLPVRPGDVRKKRHLPLQVVALLHSVAETELHALRMRFLRCAQRAVAEQASANDIPLELAESEELGDHHRVARPQILDASKALGGEDLVVGCRCELRTTVAARSVNGDR